MGSTPQIDLFNFSPSAMRHKWQDIVMGTHRIWTWTTENELSWLAELASRHSGDFVEIGSFVGRSAKVQLLASSTLSVTSLDTWDDAGTYEEYQFNLRKEDEHGRVRTIVGPSHDGLQKLRSEGHIGEFQYAFIDGGHLYDDVRGDIVGILPMLKKGAIICGHDYRANLPEDGVTKAVRELLPNHKNVVDSIWACQL
jgi:predicted O-methyltransferase YrrM